MDSEKKILNDTLCELSGISESTVWRNNTGMAWQGKRLNLIVGGVLRIEPGMVVLREARPVHFGLEGSADVIGAVQGLPVAVETKALHGSQRTAQANFEAAWRLSGGLYVLARSSAEAIAGVLAGLKKKKR